MNELSSAPEAGRADHAGAVRAAPSQEEKAAAADWVLAEFNAYYGESRGIPELAQRAFEERDAARRRRS